MAGTPFQPGNRAAAGHHNRGNPKLTKPYSDAAREFLAMSNDAAFPPEWGDRKTWTYAQKMVERHASFASAGDLDMTKWLVERAEGKSAMAPEDRAAVKGAAAANLLGGMAAINALQMALGLIKRAPEDEDAIDSEEVVTPKELT